MLKQFALLVVCMAALVHAQNHFNLFSAFGISPFGRVMPTGTQAVNGPRKGPYAKKKTKGIDFGEEGQAVDEIKNSGTEFAEIAGRLQAYDQVALSVYFNIFKVPDVDIVYYPFFSMAEKDGSQNFFSVGMQLKQECTIVEGKKICKDGDKKRWSVNIRNWRNKRERVTSLPKAGENPIEFTMGEWTSLVVKIKLEQVEVYMNCKLVASGTLLDKKDGWLKDNPFRYEGTMRLGQIKVQIGLKQFVGAMFQPQLMFGELSYQWYSPCTRDFSVSPMKAEPRAWQWDATKFNRFQDMNSEAQVSVKIWCYEEDGTPRRNNGDPWYKDDDRETMCYQYSCKNGAISVLKQCLPCRDKYNRRIRYDAGKTWIDKNDKCKRWICKASDVMTTERISEKIVCPTLKCAAEDQYQPTGACCKKCRQDDCTQARVWGMGCERSCDSNVDPDSGVVPASDECRSERKGCWCAKGEALNLDGNKCVPIPTCGCKVYSGNDQDGNPTYKRYKPGQSIRKSLCEMCLCAHGVLSCSKQC